MSHPSRWVPGRSAAAALIAPLGAALMSLLPAAPIAPASAQEPVKPAEAAAETPKPQPPALTDEQRRLNVESFDIVWETIRDKHFDPQLNGVDWAAVRDELRPKVEAATTLGEARRVMSELIGRLKQSHFGIIPRDAYRDVEATTRDRSGPGQTGIEVGVVDDQALVIGLLEGSPAAEAGVKTGWRIVKIDGEEVAPVIEKVGKAFADSTQREFRLSRSVAARLGGQVGDTIPVEFLDGDDKPVTKELPLARPQGIPARFGNLPTYYVQFESKPIEGSIRYVRLNAFFDPVRVIQQFGEAVKSHSDAEGLIVDIRGNPGGIGAMAMGIGGWLVDGSDLKLGTMSTRDTKLHFSLNPRVGAFLGPVAVLIDGSSLSTSEILAGGLKDLGRARIFGTRTGGAALPSIIVKLPNGDGFQYAFANYISAGGQPLEGKGVSPDTETPPSRQALLEGRDNALEAAVAWIRAQKKS